MSYYRVLGLEREPFSTSPDPAFFYESSNHKAALANLMIELRLRRGLSVVLGDVGTGKTTLGRKLIQMLRDREGFLFHLILDPSYPSEELFLKALTRTLGIEVPSGNASMYDYKELLERHLFEIGTRRNQTLVLIIDEAQKLNPMSLEILRILLNYETNEHKLLQLVLLAQIELMPNLVNMQNLLDRISMKYILEPLGEEETRELIDYRIKQAGFKGHYHLFLDGAVKEIYRFTGGYPRKVAMLCHKALKSLVMKNREVVDRGIIEELVNQEVRAGWHSISPLQKSSFLS
ncbi:MAG: AAA family ATPase [Candidatus Omnitrophica bacterium]|nr:AAA family ATPase [Candidatus Omnitrophota bacterium]